MRQCVWWSSSGYGVVTGGSQCGVLGGGRRGGEGGTSAAAARDGVMEGCEKQLMEAGSLSGDDDGDTLNNNKSNNNNNNDLHLPTHLFRSRTRPPQSVSELGSVAAE